MIEKHYTVTGMSCGHCASSITEVVIAIDKISEVDVDLAASTVTVRGSAVDDELVSAAITEAGYGVCDAVEAA
jgi:copper chaperone